MAVNPGFTTTIPAGRPYFRMTSPAFHTTNPADYVKVVNGQGAVNNSQGARYNYPGALTVYLTEDVDTCVAERMFYFHREILRGLDISHHTGVIPPFQKNFVLWEIMFIQSIANVFDMNVAGAPSYFYIFPALTVNPSQDYEHLKKRRSEIQSQGYKGLRVQSSRARSGGNLIVLFEDQSHNVQTITPYPVEFRLLTPQGTSFINHTQDLLDFTAGEVRITGALPVGGQAYQQWRRVEFNH